jgi:hypothetical protein
VIASRFASTVGAALVALAVAVPCDAQGKGGGKKPAKGPTRPPSANAVSTPTSAGGGIVIGDEAMQPTTPFAWMDDASVLAPGDVWLGVSMARWQGSGLSQTTVPVFDGAIGLTSRVQLGASVPRAGGGIGTTFVSAKIALLNDESRALKLSIGPTLEILDRASMDAAAPGQGRANWGLPVSAQIDHGISRVYASAGYFAPGIWFAGAGIGRPVGDRVGVSVSFSHAWATSEEPPAPVLRVAAPRRNEISGGASYDLKSNIAVFGSIGRTIGLAAEDGAGTTLGFGLSLTSPAVFAR